MDWFLYDNGLRHKGVNYHYNKRATNGRTGKDLPFPFLKTETKCGDHVHLLAELLI